MGKNLIQQRRGRGSPRYLAPSHRYRGQVAYRPLEKTDKEMTAKVIDIMHDPGRTSPVALIRFEDGDERLIVAPEGLKVGDTIEYLKGNVASGNVMNVKDVPEGVPIHNIENVPGDGGKFARTSGSYGFVVSRAENKVTIKLPSGKVIDFNPNCRVTIGIPGGSGRIDKPITKAGISYKMHRARGKFGPRSSGSKMNPVDHPYGGRNKPGWTKTTSVHAPPGQKVGSIGARRTGKR